MGIRLELYDLTDLRLAAELSDGSNFAGAAKTTEINMQGREAVIKVSERAAKRTKSKRARLCYPVATLGSFGFFSSYSESERLQDSSVENITGANWASCCWLTTSGDVLCWCCGLSALQLCEGTAAVGQCCESAAMTHAVGNVAGALGEVWKGIANVSFESVEQDLLVIWGGGGDPEMSMGERWSHGQAGVCEGSMVDERGKDVEEEGLVDGEVRACELLRDDGRLVAVVCERTLGRALVVAPVLLSKKEYPVCLLFSSSAGACVHVAYARPAFENRTRRRRRASGCRVAIGNDSPI